MKRIGILGGGQLGRMFLQNAMNYPFHYHVLDPNAQAPARSLCHQFVLGDFRDYQTVLEFAQEVDIITIEIEQVNIEALQELERQGKTVIPSVSCLALIQDKAQQKQTFRKHNIPTSEFFLIDAASELSSFDGFPVIQKTRVGGYDGKGVQLLQSSSDIIWDTPSVIEKVVDIEKELAVIVAVGACETLSFPTVEMIFDQKLNLVDELFSPAQIEHNIDKEAQKLALKVAESFQSKGLFAVEMFLDRQQNLWVNEVAPRLHNSGHHTIEANYYSQFDIMLRCITDLSLPSTDHREVATMVNIVAQSESPMDESVFCELMDKEKTYFHWYGKTQARKGRKMGHITILGERDEKICQKIKEIKQTIKKII